MKYFLIFLISIIWFFPKNIFSQNNTNNLVTISQEIDFYPLGYLVEILEDKTRKMTFEEVVLEKNNLDFKISKQKFPNHSYSVSNYWFKIQVANPTQKEMLLVFENPNIDKLDVYFVNDKKEIIKTYKTGDTYPFSSRPVDFYKFAFPFPKIEKFDIYVKLSGYYLKKHNLSLMHENVMLSEAQYKSVGIIFSVAIMFGLIIYNLLLYLSIRDKAYFYYIVYLSGTCGYIMAINGLGFQYLYPNIPQITHLVANISVVVAVMAVFPFVVHFLQLRTWLPKIYLRLMSAHTFFGWFLILGLVICGYVYPVGLSLLFNIISFYVVVTSPIILLLGILGVLRGLRSARFFLLAWCILVFSTIIYVGHSLGIPFSYDFIDNFIRFAIIVEVFLLSFGLSDKIKITEREKREAQAQNLKLIQEQNIILEEKVTRRTKELQETNNELSTTLEVVKIQKNEIQSINKHLTDSINYAQRIQASILPPEKLINEHLPQNFVLFEPKDVVSGDFYWFDVVKNKKIFAAVDCTGHGVPGAFMSMIGNDCLNEIIQFQQTTNSGEILAKLNKHINYTLQQQETLNRDGMDMVLCVWDEDTRMLQYSGAKNSLYYVTDNQFFEVKSSKFPIGGIYKKEDMHREYEVNEIHMPNDAWLYLCSDGYQDQFSKDDHKKFSRQRLRDLLFEINLLSPLQQQEKLWQATMDWRGEEEQIDDILIFGVKV